MKKTIAPLVAITTLAAALTMSLSGCNSLSDGIADDGVAAKQLVWPAVTDTNALARRGSYPTPETVALLRPGLDKSQILGLLGAPHFNEGMAGAREWDYVFHLRSKDSANERICQFKVLFNRDASSGSMYWLPEGCNAPLPVAVAAPAAPVVAPPAPVAPAPKVYTLAAAALFAFDKASLSHMPAQGVEQLKALVGDLRQAGRGVRTVEVQAYTDRLGSSAYNLDLSRRRALSVRDYLVAQGIAPGLIHAEGLGEADPVSPHCANDLPHAALIDCLAPDRRVVVRVTWAQP